LIVNRLSQVPLFRWVEHPYRLIGIAFEHIDFAEIAPSPKSQTLLNTKTVAHALADFFYRIVVIDLQIPDRVFFQPTSNPFGNCAFK
jgi:hypothetical protein